MKKAILLIIALSSLAIPELEAKTTRVFAGNAPWQVERAAKEAGYDYPSSKMECSQRCRQRWAQD